MHTSCPFGERQELSCFTGGRLEVLRLSGRLLARQAQDPGSLIAPFCQSTQTSKQANKPTETQVGKQEAQRHCLFVPKCQQTDAAWGFLPKGKQASQGLCHVAGLSGGRLASDPSYVPPCPNHILRVPGPHVDPTCPPWSHPWALHAHQSLLQESPCLPREGSSSCLQGLGPSDLCAW